MPFAEAPARTPGRLRIAVTTLSPIEEGELDAEAVRSVRVAADVLRGLGHEVVEADPPWRVPDVLRLFTAVFGPNRHELLQCIELRRPATPKGQHVILRAGQVNISLCSFGGVFGMAAAGYEGVPVCEQGPLGAEMPTRIRWRRRQPSQSACREARRAPSASA